MGMLDSLKAWFRTESAEAANLAQGTKGRLEADLDRREADLNLTPEERLEQIQQQIDDDIGFDQLRDKIEGRHLKADATTEVAEAEAEARQSADDVLDLPSEEVDSPEPPPTA